MFISIVIPTYNGSAFVEEAISSVLSQTVAPDEIIISDDNSSDDTLRICAKYSDRVKIFTNANGPSGFVNGWNNAIAKASGDYISILHQDDTLHPNFVEEIKNAVKMHADVLHFFVPCQYIDAESKVSKTPDYCDGRIKRYTGLEYVNAYQTIGTPHIHRCPGVVTHRSIFEQCKYREEAGHIADDDFFYRVGQYTDVVGILKPLASYRQHNGSETGSLDDSDLVKRLIKDFSFQIKHINENMLFTKDEFIFMKNKKNKFIKRLIGYGLKQGNLPYIIYSLKYLLNLR